MKNKIKLYLSKYPRMLNIIRFTRYLIYRCTILIYRYIIYFKWRRFKLQKNISFVNIPLNKDKSSFFGYYNISPWNNKSKILFYETNSNKKRADINSKLEIKIYDMPNKKVFFLSESISWNWQQGCMLQWYSSDGDKIIYNNFSKEDDAYYSEILNIYKGYKKRICAPIYSVSPNGIFALTLNFERLAYLCPDYGYFRKKKLRLPEDKDDGIWLIDFKENKKTLIISLNDLKQFKPDPSMREAKHKVNHIDIAPNGKRFMFLHRWICKKGRFMRLLTSSCDGKYLHFVTGNIMVSHSCWWGSEDIISFCRIPDGRDRYVNFKDKKGAIEIIGENDFLRDGHPSISPDKCWMLTDDYPDSSRFSSLYLYDLKNKKKYNIGEFYQPFIFRGEMRIDLHPKWSIDGKLVSIDSGHNGKRQLYIIDVSKIVNPY